MVLEEKFPKFMGHSDGGCCKRSDGIFYIQLVNLLHKITIGGNLEFKIDISKAIDTLNWEFLMKILNAFGLNSQFFLWIETILNSIKLYVLIKA
jgi:hypothetical protein